MLYDPKWGQSEGDLTHENVSLRAFIAWLENQPPYQEYEFTDPFACAIGQHLESLGYSRDERCVMLEPVEPANKHSWLTRIVHTKPWTFGDALTRARKCAALTAGQEK